MIALLRTSPPTKENRRHGLTQFLVDMKTPGITVNPIDQITGQYEFNEVVFHDAFVPDDHVLGDLAQHMVVGNEGIGEYHLVEFKLPGDLLDGD